MKERPILFSGPLVREILAGQKTMTRRPVKSLRVRLRHEVCSDLPASIRPVVRYGPGVYAAGMNQHGAVHVIGADGDLGVKPGEFDFQCPYAEGRTHLEHGRPAWHLQVAEGQRLWVRETFSRERLHVYPCPHAWYRADLDEHEYLRHPEDGYCSSGGLDCLHGIRWTPGIHMPRRLCRLVLEVKDVRVERLWEITEEDARREGVEPASVPCAADASHPSPTPSYVRGFLLKWAEIYGNESWDANPWVWVVSFRRVEG